MNQYTYVFLTNYYNHHQAPFSEAMDVLTGHRYCLIETEPMDLERKKMGWGRAELPSYIISAYRSRETKELCQKIINGADVVITGSAPDEMLRQRIKNGSLIIRYSERIYKDGYHLRTWPARIFKYARKYNHKNMFLLCASAYSATDFLYTGNFFNKTYKWGYFPETRTYHLEELFKRKENGKVDVSILWVGRFIEWKHPEIPIRIAKRLKESGYSFELNMIGNGELESKQEKLIADEDLQDCVHLLGAMSPSEVRNHMEKSDIFLFTSDFNEGWGAVLNEAMNSGCASVVSHAIGAAPFLIQDGVNGLLYKNDDEEQLYQKVRFLIENKGKRKAIGENAYKTIVNIWNAETAAERFIRLANDLQENGISERFSEGPCSKAKILRNGWYKE